MNDSHENSSLRMNTAGRRESFPCRAASASEDGANRHVVAAFRAGADAALVERAARGAAPSGAVRAHLYHLLPTGVQKKHREGEDNHQNADDDDKPMIIYEPQLNGFGKRKILRCAHLAGEPLCKLSILR